LFRGSTPLHSVSRARRECVTGQPDHPSQEAAFRCEPLGPGAPRACPPAAGHSGRPEGIAAAPHTASLSWQFLSGVFSQPCARPDLAAGPEFSQVFSKAASDPGPERRSLAVRTPSSGCASAEQLPDPSSPADTLTIGLGARSRRPWTSVEQLLAAPSTCSARRTLAGDRLYFRADDVVSTWSKRPAQLDVILTGVHASRP